MLLKSHPKQAWRKVATMLLWLHCMLAFEKRSKSVAYLVIPKPSMMKSFMRTPTKILAAKKVTAAIEEERMDTAEDFIKEAFESGVGLSKHHKERIIHPYVPVKETRPFPLGMIVGQEDIKRALMLAAVNPGIGIAIYGSRGTGKSVLARAAYRILPQTIERIKGSPYNIDPNGTERVDTFLQNQMLKSGQSLQDFEMELIPTPFVQIPLNVMEDSLLGTVDLEKSMQTGTTIFSPGLLAKAHRGVLYVDEINLLDEDAINILLNVVVDGYVTVEREGLSVQYPCKPLLIATYNPEEGELREHFLDRIGVVLSSDARPLSVLERTEATENVLGFTGGTATQCSDEATKKLVKAEEEEEAIREKIEEARSTLARVEITSSQILYICEEATGAGCEGQRAEIFATECAKASAALDGRTEVNAKDLQLGVILSIAPRGIYEMPDSSMQPPLPLMPNTPTEQERQDPEQDMQDMEDKEDEQESEESESEDLSEEEELEVPLEFMFGVDEATQIDPRLMYFNKWARKGKGGKSSRIFNLQRGRYVKPVFPKGKKGKIAIAATLRAAAPYQKFRRTRAEGTSKGGRLVQIYKDDFRIKRMARKAGSLIIFVVDASGSMALNRMDAAKGATLTLLSEAYKHRDKISLVAFREQHAEVVVPPTKSMAFAKSRLEGMPCGGGSPMAHALMIAMRTGLNSLKVKQDVGRVVIVLLTDGRANVPLYVSMDEEFDSSVDPESMDGRPSRAYVKDEVLAFAKKLGALKDFSLLCIDTEDRFVATGMAREIARAALGNYYHIERSDAANVSRITKQGLESARIK